MRISIQMSGVIYKMEMVIKSGKYTYLVIELGNQIIRLLRWHNINILLDGKKMAHFFYISSEVLLNCIWLA